MGFIEWRFSPFDRTICTKLLASTCMGKALEQCMADCKRTGVLETEIVFEILERPINPTVISSGYTKSPSINQHEKRGRKVPIVATVSCLALNHPSPKEKKYTRKIFVNPHRPHNTTESKDEIPKLLSYPNPYSYLHLPPSLTLPIQHLKNPHNTHLTAHTSTKPHHCRPRLQ